MLIVIVRLFFLGRILNRDIDLFRIVVDVGVEGRF